MLNSAHHFELEAWERVDSGASPLWIRPADGTWFVPNRAGDRLLVELRDGAVGSLDVAGERFLGRLPPGPGVAPPARGEALALEGLSELWLHLTDRCDLACRHCLFRCSPRRDATLPTDRALALCREAFALGCRLFALTGGEPTVHPGFDRVVDGILELGDTHVVVLTNGTSLDPRAGGLTRWPRDRLHLQVSLDGLRETHDHLRGAGAFDALLERLDRLRDAGWPVTVSAAVTRATADDLPGIVDVAAERGATNLHLMWFFERGRGTADQRPALDRVVERVCEATARAEALGIGFDTVDALRSQVFAPAGTVHDGTNAGWTSLAIGPDGRLYPTGATVGLEALATPLDSGLERAWRRSAVLERVRRLTARDDPSPWAAILGGGDLDHRVIGGGRLDAEDPLRPIQERLAAWLITREAARLGDVDGWPALRLERGDVLESCGAEGAIAMTHSSCLLAVAGRDSRHAVRELYTRAAETPDEEIRNPVAYPPDLIQHVPDEARVRSYGCGSPVLDADPAPGETVIDLGSGTGVECFIASRLVGPEGQVIGVDMLEPMLERARAGAKEVARRLGWSNLRFEKGFLEALPADDGIADAVISNCVINLAVHKRRAFAEILRVLRPGGRLVVSDVVCDDEPPADIRNDDRLRGECIAGALTRRQLFGLLTEVGFVGLRELRRFPYRQVQGHPFFSSTYMALKPSASRATVRVALRGPAPLVLTPSGRRLSLGSLAEIPLSDAEALGDLLFILDEQGAVTNVELGASSCCCAPEPAPSTEDGCCCCGEPASGEGAGAS